MAQSTQEFALIFLFNFLLCSASLFAPSTSSPTIKSYIVPVTRIKAKTSLAADAEDVRAVTLPQTLGPTYTFQEAKLNAAQIDDSILAQSASTHQFITSHISNSSPEPSYSSASVTKPLVVLPVTSVSSPLATVKSTLKKSKSLRQGRFLNHKKVRIFKILSNIIGGDDDYDDPKTSKTAKVIGDITGEIIGLIINDRFRAMGELVGDLARENVRDILVASLDSVFKNIISVRNK